MVLAKSLLLISIVVSTAFVLIPFSILFFSKSYLTFEIESLRFLGFLPIGIGSGLALWTVFSFVFIGNGTPAPIDPPKKLVTTGLFSYVRNPMYLGAVMIFGGEGLLLQSFGLFVYAAVMWVFFHLFVVYYEEPNLRERFGREYEEYSRNVPRWFPSAPKQGAIKERKPPLRTETHKTM